MVKLQVCNKLKPNISDCLEKTPVGSGVHAGSVHESGHSLVQGLLEKQVYIFRDTVLITWHYAQQRVYK